MKRPYIEINNLSFAIGNKTILDSISLTIYESEYLSIIGPNGAGKTTLLKCLMRIYSVKRGSISLLGIPIERYRQKDLAKHISYVPQSDGRIMPYTVKEFIMMGRYPHLSPFTSIIEADKKAVRDALALTGITHIAERYLDTLSGGERQTVLIAAALAQGSPILLLDEPTTFLDPKHETDVYKILKKINNEYGITIVSVTHNINSAVLQSDRIVILKNGATAFSGNAPDIMNNEILERIYEKPFTFVNHPTTNQVIIAPEVIVP